MKNLKVEEKTQGVGFTSKTATRELTMMAMLAAISVVLLVFIRIPIIPAAPYLIYDMADVAILVAAFFMGRKSGFKVLAVVCLLQMILLSGDGLIGFIMHFVATGAFILVASAIYEKSGQKRLLISLIAGALTATILMIPMNFVFTGWFLGVPMSTIAAMLVPAIIPFNLIKFGLNALIFFFIFNAVKLIMKRA